MRRRLMCLAFGAILTASPLAVADPHGDAAKLFEEGRRLRDRGELERALVTFRASAAAEPSVGSLFNIGLVNEALGHLPEALSAYRASATLARDRNDPRAREVLGAVAALREKHDYIVLETPPEVERAVGLVVTVDGEAVPPAEMHGEVFRPGPSHELVVHATGRVDRVRRVGDREIATVTLGEPAPRIAPALPQVSSASTASSTSSTSSTQTWVGLGLVGAGVVTAIVGSVVALGYYADRDQAIANMKHLCTMATRTATNGCAVPGSKPPLPTAAAQRILNDASSLDATATRRNLVVFGLAGALVAGGGIVVFTAPRKGKSTERESVRLTPDVTRTDVGLHAVGEF